MADFVLDHNKKRAGFCKFIDTPCIQGVPLH